MNNVIEDKVEGILNQKERKRYSQGAQYFMKGMKHFFIQEEVNLIKEARKKAFDNVLIKESRDTLKQANNKEENEDESGKNIRNILTVFLIGGAMVLSSSNTAINELKQVYDDSKSFFGKFSNILENKSYGNIEKFDKIVNEFGVKNFSFEDKIKELFSEIKKPIKDLYELFYKHIYGFFNEKTYKGENVFEIMIDETGRELVRRILDCLSQVVDYLSQEVGNFFNNVGIVGIIESIRSGDDKGIAEILKKYGMQGVEFLKPYRRQVADMSMYYKFGPEVLSEISGRENARLNHQEKILSELGLRPQISSMFDEVNNFITNYAEQMNPNTPFYQNFSLDDFNNKRKIIEEFLQIQHNFGKSSSDKITLRELLKKNGFIIKDFVTKDGKEIEVTNSYITNYFVNNSNRKDQFFQELKQAWDSIKDDDLQVELWEDFFYNSIVIDEKIQEQQDIYNREIQEHQFNKKSFLNYALQEQIDFINKIKKTEYQNLVDSLLEGKTTFDEVKKKISEHEIDFRLKAKKWDPYKTVDLINRTSNLLSDKKSNGAVLYLNRVVENKNEMLEFNEQSTTSILLDLIDGDAIIESMIQKSRKQRNERMDMVLLQLQELDEFYKNK